MSKTYYIPGLGADMRLFSNMLTLLPGDQVQWPKNLGNSLQELAKKIVDTHDFCSDDVVVGFSFGAQVAREIKAIKPTIKVVSLSSVTCSNELTLTFKLCANVCQFIPNLLLKKMIIHFGVGHASKNDTSLRDEELILLKLMAKDLNMNFFKETLKLCANWKEDIDVDTFCINGEYDTVVPYNKNKVDFILKNAGHLITYTHYEQIIEEIKNYAKV